MSISFHAFSKQEYPYPAESFSDAISNSANTKKEGAALL